MRFGRRDDERIIVFYTVVVCCCLLAAVSCRKSESLENPAESNKIIVVLQPPSNPSEKLPDDASVFEKTIPLKIALAGRLDAVTARILKDYGAMFVARGGVEFPAAIVFADAEECAAWQRTIPAKEEIFGGVKLALQPAAMDALLAARDELRARRLDISARGTWGGRRDYADTRKIWLTRLAPGLRFWTRRGKLSAGEAARIGSLAPTAQIGEVLRLEAKRLFFSKDFAKSVLYSATPPGASQHISMLAVDIVENENANVRQILAKHGWFQTVMSDAPHFTYLGAGEDELPALGLKKIRQNGRVFWIPDL